MINKDIALRKDVSVRLRAVMSELGIATNPEFAEWCAATGGRVNNWLIANNLPLIPQMVILCERTGITMDWIYRGHFIKDAPLLADLQGGVTLADRLSEIRAAIGPMTHAEFGKVCGGAEASLVKNWHNSAMMPRPPNMIALCDNAGVTLDWIYRGVRSSEKADQNLMARIDKRIETGDYKKPVQRAPRKDRKK